MSTRLKTYLLAAFFLIVLLGVYSNHFHNGFHFDDSHTIVDNMYIRSIDNIPLFFQDASTLTPLPINQSYRPVITTSYAIDYWLGGGLDPFFFHLSTFLWFLLTCLLLFVLFRKITEHLESGLPTGPIVFLAVAWYAVHAANAETVNYISARSDVISTTMVLLAMVMFLSSGASRKFHLYLIPLLIGILAKPTAVMFAPLLFTYLWLSEGLLPALRKSVPAVIVSGGLFAFTAYMAPESYAPGGTSVWEYAITQPYVISRYFLAFFAPIHLSADSDLLAFTSIADPRLWIGIVFLGSLLFLILRTFRYKQLIPITFGLLWFLIALAPSSSFVPLAEVMNDHRMFFPFIGLVIAVSWSLGLFWLYLVNSRIKRVITNIVVTTVVGTIIVGNSFGAYARNKVWKTDESLWYDVTIKSPQNGRGLMNYGLVKMRKGEYDEALKYFEKALVYNPYYTYLHFNLGVLKSLMGRENEAEAHFQSAIQLGPEYPEAYYFYGEWLHRQGRIQEAAGNLEQCLKLSSAHLKARYVLMVIYNSSQEWDLLERIATETLVILPNDESARLYLKMSQERKSPLEAAQELVKSNPTAANLVELSLHYYRVGQLDSCIAVCNRAIIIDPNNKEAYNNICSAYNEKKMWGKAIEACNAAIRIDSTYKLAINNRAWAIGQLAAQDQASNE